MNKIKHIIYSFVILFSFVLAFSILKQVGNNNSLSNKKIMEISQKNLFRLKFGNDYYKAKGMQIVFNDKKSKLFYNNNSFLISAKEDIYNNFNKIILFDKEINASFYLNENQVFKVKPFTIFFNDYNHHNFTIFPYVNKEFVELSRNRYSKIYSLSENYKLKLISSENKEPKQLGLNNINVYEKTFRNIQFLDSLGVKASFNENLMFIHNPLTNIYSIFPNLYKFNNENSIDLNVLKEKLNLVKGINKKKSLFKINQDTVITNNLILKNKIFKIDKNIRIKLERNANIIVSDSEISFAGKNAGIYFTGSDKSSIYILNSPKTLINNTHFLGFSKFENDTISLPSAITFINSKVSLVNSSFKNNYDGDDYVNLFQCEFKINKCEFYNILNDAVDSDFSNGEISESLFKDIGNDGIDMSGSNIFINKNKFDNIEDKCISAGENSITRVSENKIYNSEIALVCKDGSQMESINNMFINNRLDIVAFKKKSFYKHPIIKIDTTAHSLNYLFQENSIIHTSDSIQNLKFLKDVESLLYGNFYGKASG